MESLLLAAVVALAVWLFMRNARAMRARRRRPAEPPQASGDASAGGDTPTLKSMPRLGAAGTITRQQVAALREMDFEPARQWSREEAQLILDSVTYLRAAIRLVTGEAGAPIEVQNKVLNLILGDDGLRESIFDWGLNRTREEEDAGDDVELPDDETFDRIADCIRELWEDD